MSEFIFHEMQPGAPHNEIPASTQAMIEYNHAQLHGPQFRDAHGAESAGGNAGDVWRDGKNYVCSAVNGYAHADSGRFALFHNYAHNNYPEITTDPAYKPVIVTLGLHISTAADTLRAEQRVIGLQTEAKDVFSQHAVDAMLGGLALYDKDMQRMSEQA